MSNFNDSHLRALQAIVSVVEEKIQAIEDRICGVGVFQNKNVQMLTRFDITEDEEEFINEQITEMRVLLGQFAAEYSLHQQEQSLRNVLLVKAAFLWEELSGATFNRLQGYGTLEPSERIRYDHQVKSMTKLAEKLMLILNPNQNENKAI